MFTGFFHWQDAVSSLCVLAGCSHISLGDAAAENHWASLVRAGAHDKAFQSKYYAHDQISGDVVYLDGTVKRAAPPCFVVTPRGDHADSRQHEINAFADCCPPGMCDMRLPEIDAGDAGGDETAEQQEQQQPPIMGDDEACLAARVQHEDHQRRLAISEARAAITLRARAATDQAESRHHGADFERGRRRRRVKRGRGLLIWTAV